jgi:hypothetical protein
MDAEQPAEPGPARSGARPPVSHLVIGTVTLTGERLRLIGEKQLPAIALTVGLVAEGRDAVGRAVRRTRQAIPTGKVREVLDTASSHGRQTMDASQAETAQWLAATGSSVGAPVKNATSAPVKWVERTVIPKIVDDMMPYVIGSVMPKVIEEMLPQIRTVVVPVIIDDLTSDPRVRTMIAEQSSGVVAAATDELREAAADADDHVESAFRSVFRRHSTAV